MGVIGGHTAREAIDGLRSRPAARFLPHAALGIGLALGAGALLRYEGSGYGRSVLSLWIAALGVLSVFFWSRSRSVPRIARLDVAISGGLAFLFAPLYLHALDRWPVQVNADEVVVTSVARDYGARVGVDPFGISNYLARPSGLFVLWGNLAELLGEVDLYNVRVLHALFGLLTIAAAYVLLRQLLPRWWAVFATALVGINHAFLMISRLAMRENTAVLVEVVALALLFWGLRKDHELATFAGGLVAALGMYVYVPGRAVFPLWVFFLLLCLFLRRDLFPRRQLARLGAIAAAGFVLMAGPVMIAESKIPSTTNTPQSDVLFINKEARELQQGWVFAPSFWEAYKTNISHGLGAFNNNEEDNAWIYKHPGHGFVDPLTGILLWLGVGVVAVGLVRRRRRDLAALLVLGSFVVLYLSFAFLINKAPSYPRMLIILPFVAYLVTEGVRWLADRWRTVRLGSVLVTAGLLSAIVVWNASIAWDFIQDGRKHGEPIGSTANYVKAHRDVPGQRFYFANQDTNGSLRYYEWGDPDSRIALSVRDSSQLGGTIDPSALSGFEASPPFALFMRRGAWNSGSSYLVDRYPQGRLRNVMPDGTRVVLEVPAS